MSSSWWSALCTRCRVIIDRNKGLVVLIVATLSWSQMASQEAVIVDELGTADGLSYRWVFDLKTDQHGFLWIATYDGLNRYDGNKFHLFRHESQDSNSLPGNRVRSLLPDQQGRIWLSIEGTNASYYDPLADHFTNFTSDPSQPTSILDQEADRFFEDHSGAIWIGFKVFNDKSYAIQRYLGKEQFSAPIKLHQRIRQVRNISQDQAGNIWIWSASNGYIRINPIDDTVTYFSNFIEAGKSHSYLPIVKNAFWYPSYDQNDGALSPITLPSLKNEDQWNNFFVDDQQNIWLHTNQNRVFRSDRSKSEFEFIIQLDFDLLPNGADVPPQDLAFLVDRENIIWIGHFFGITKVVKPLTLFETYLNGKRTKLGMPINGVSARAMVETASGRVFLYDQPGQLYHLDQELKQAVQIVPNQDLGFSENSFNGIGMFYEEEEDLIWIGTPDGLLSYDDQTGGQVRYPIPDSLPQGLIHEICPGVESNLWLARTEGNLIFNLADKTFAMSPLPKLGLNYCYCQPRQEVIWSGHKKGLVQFNSKTHDFQYFPLFDDARPGGEILSIAPFDDHLWLGGYQGLVKFDPRSGDYVQYTTADGLPHDIIYSVIPSGKELWLGTHSGLTRFNPTTLEMTTFYEEQGLTHNEFNRSSYLKTKDGKLFFGGLNGVNAFYPTQLSNTVEPTHSIHLMQWTRYDESSDTLRSNLWHELQGVNQLIIQPREKDVTFDFAMTSLADPSYNQYFHMLEGLDSDWKSNGPLATARYNQIPAGSYVLRARAKDPHGNPTINEINIQLLVKQIWYQRWWFQAVLALLLCAIALGIYRFNLKRSVANEERKRLIELDNLKTKLYTNITHEFRTPLTVILGMNEALRKRISPKIDPSGIQAIDLIKRNGESLLRLINQMLDLSKLDSGRLQLNLQQTDLVQYLRQISEGFEIWAKQKEIGFHFFAGQEAIMMDFDPTKLQQVITNLIGNSIKFTPKGGNIYFKVDCKNALEVNMSIQDTGMGIPPEKLSYIFDRFYQVDSDTSRNEDGSGIGLALTKELVTLMDGQIKVESNISTGTKFTITLPVRHDMPVAGTSPKVIENLPNEKPNINIEVDSLTLVPQQSKPIILIVEDNPDVAQLIQISLQEKYEVLIAADGIEGTEMAIQALPDIVVSDVMMPRRDGFELCKMLKMDARTNHIPVLLLTARVDQADKMKGLAFGADAYLAKPFESTELQLRLDNFLRLRAKMQGRYQNGGPIEPLKEDPFMTVVRRQIEDHLADEHFGIVQLCRAMQLSRAQLHRKITALTGTSTSLYIRKIRLHRASQLLNEGELSISEIGKAVGFKGPSQFSRAFKEEYGRPPTDAQ